MNLNYDKIKHKMEEGSNPWTSYSDLFLVLSVVFLLLYVVANIRASSVSISQQAQVVELKKQIKVYEALKDDYLKKDASQDEIQVYQDLMNKMDLLQTDAKNENVMAQKKARDAAEKEKNLNYYQKLVKNIITANLVSSRRVKKRDDIIQEQDTSIASLNQTVDDREKEINKNNETIGQIQSELQGKIQEVKSAFQANKQTKESMEQQIAQLNEDSTKRIDALRGQNTQYAAQLTQTKTELEQKNREAEQIQSELQRKIQEVKSAFQANKQTKESMEQQIALLNEESAKRINALRGENSQYVAQLSQTKGALEQKSRESEQLMNSLRAKQAEFQAKIAEEGAKHEADVARERAAFEAGLKREKLGAEARVAQERKFRAQEEARAKEYQSKLSGLNGELEKTRGSIKDIAGKYQASLNAMGNANTALQKSLVETNKKLNQQRVLAEQIQKNFKKAGVHATVDEKTGDVMIDFQNEYFDTGKANLKPGMLSTLSQTIPVYANSLFMDENIAKRINSVEIVGFASPTYKGKSVDPSSLSENDRTAVNFNMDLSYQRAKSIFEHVFDTTKMQFPHQQRLLPLVKVSGRSYLATDRLPASDVAKNKAKGLDDYCSKYDCKKSQRVIIKFNLRDE